MISPMEIKYEEQITDLRRELANAELREREAQDIITAGRQQRSELVDLLQKLYVHAYIPHSKPELYDELHRTLLRFGAAT